MKKKIFTSLMLALLLVSSAVSFASPEDGLGDGLYVKDGVLMCDCGVALADHHEAFQDSKKAFEENGIEPRANMCFCGGRISITLGTPTPWSPTGKSKKCSHKAYGHDYEHKRTRTAFYACNKCSYRDSGSKTETKWVCKGW